MSNPIQYIRSLVKKGLNEKGDNTYSYLACLSMFVKRGRFRYIDFFSAISKGAESRSLYDDLLKGVNTRYLEEVLSCLIKGLKVPVVKLTDAEGRSRP